MADTLARVMAVTANRFQMSRLFVRGPVTRFHIPLVFARPGPPSGRTFLIALRAIFFGVGSMSEHKARHNRVG
jgi:hypothetical protein